MRHQRLLTRQKRTKRQRCRTCRSNNGKRACPALSGMIICPECCSAKRAKIPGCDHHCRYYSPLIVKSRKVASPEFPLHLCLVSRSRDTGMLIVVGTRKRPDGNIKAMFILLDLWKKGVRDCFYDANLSEKQFERACQRFGNSYAELGQALPEEKKEETDAENIDTKHEPIRIPRNTLIIEAETAMHFDNGVNIVEDEEASNQRAIDSARGARAIYEVNIPKTGKWYVWIRTYYKTSSQDSYWIGIEDVEPYPWDQEGGPNAIKIWAVPGDNSKWNRWLWDTSTHPLGKKIPGYFNVKHKGYYRLWSKGREPGTRLDQILLTRSRRFNPQNASEGKPIPTLTVPHPYEPATFEECKKLIRHGVEISKAVETEFPWEFKYWLSDMWGDIRKFSELEGSLYKCHKCEEDLPDQAVNLIKQHAHSDDIQFYILCRKCGGEFD